MEQLFDHLSCDTDRQQERPCLVSVWMGKAEVERDPGVLTGPCHTTAFMTDVRSPGVRQFPSHTAKSTERKSAGESICWHQPGQTLWVTIQLPASVTAGTRTST